MGLYHYTGFVPNDESGKPIKDAILRLLQDGVEQQLYSDEAGTPLGVAMSDDLGTIDFWADAGTYDFVYSYNGEVVRTLTKQQLVTDVSADIPLAIVSATQTFVAPEDGLTLPIDAEYIAGGRRYRRIVAAPGYEDMGDGAAPATQAQIKRITIDSVAALQSRPDLSYGSMSPDDILGTQSEGFAYKVLAAGAIDQDLTTAGGLKLQVLPGPNGLDGRAFGMKIDNVTDDAAALTKLAAACVARNLPLYVPRTALNVGCYLASAVNLRGVGEIDFRAPIRVNPAIVEIPVRVGGLYNSSGKTWNIPLITDGTGSFAATPPRPLLEISGLIGSKVSLGAQRYVRLTADSALNTTDAATAYNSFELDGVFGLIEITGVGTGWINENTFYGGRVIRLNILKGVGTYVHNHNVFINPTFEGNLVNIRIDGSSNRIEGARFEATTAAPGVEFLAGSDNNIITCYWSSTLDPAELFRSPSIPVVDNGIGNAVMRPQQFQWRETPLVSINPSCGLVASATACGAPDPSIGAAGPDTQGARLVPGLQTVTVAEAWRHIFTTVMIPVNKGDVIAFRADFAGSRIRTKIYVFDAEQKLLTSEGGGGAFVSQLSTTFTSGVYAQSANVAASAIAPASVQRPEVKYIVVAAWFGGVTGSIKQLSASLMAARGGPTDRTLSYARPNTIAAVSGVPTAGYMRVGYAVHDTAANILRRVTFAHETTVTAALAAGATSVTVTTASTIANGDLFGVVMDDGETHWSSISALSGATFAITAIPAGRSVAAGARAVFNRWA